MTDPPPLASQSDAAVDADGETSIEQIETPFFAGAAWPSRVEVAITRDHLSDEDNVEEFGAALMDLCRGRGGCRVLINVAALTFVTSSVLGKFIQLRRTLARDDGRLVLSSPGANFHEVLEMTNLDRYFSVRSTDAEARDVLLGDKPDDLE